MSTSNFIDYVKIFMRSGKGGQGSSHLHRDRLTSMGGPDGGDGGRGGHIILRGNQQHWTLLPLKYRKHIHAPDGESGGPSRSTGSNGKDIVLDVPLGTLVKDFETGQIEGEILEEGQEYIVMEGGKGGLGNWHFKSSVRQTPRYAQPGLEGIEGWKILELKVLADVGLVGFPNAGKSTLLATITAAKPKIANYEFTTLTPNLGIVKYRDYQSFVIADIPGIIEGASDGKGLGHRFLKHIEHNATLLFLLPATTNDIAKEYDILLTELERYNMDLSYKKRVIALTKVDMLGEELTKEMIAEFHESYPDTPIFPISSVAQLGLTELKDELWKNLNDLYEEDKFWE